MPLARILTRFPERAGVLSEELKQRGYTVEVLGPEQSGRPGADVEIDFEVCNQAGALRRASDLARRMSADVAVSPGAVQSVSLTGAALEQAEAGQPAARTESAAETVQARAAASQAPAGDTLPASPAMVELPTDILSQPFLREAGQEQSEPERPTMENSALVPDQSSRGASFHNQISQNQAFQNQLSQTRPEEAPTETEHDHEGQTSRSGKEFLNSMAAKSAQAFEAAVAFSSEAWESARHAGKEYKEKFEARRTEARAERQQKLLELEKKKALAAERTAELEAAREAAAVRLQQLLRERGGLTQSQPTPPQKETAAPTRELVRAARQAGAGVVARLRGIKALADRNFSPQVEAVMMGVAAACALFVLGLVVASFHARPALSNSLDVPQPSAATKGVTVQTGGVTLTTGAPGVTITPDAGSRTASKPKPGTPSQTGASARAHKSDVTVRRFARSKAASRSSRTESIGSDVTIRHFGPQPKKPAPTPNEAGLKRISDMD